MAADEDISGKNMDKYFKNLQRNSYLITSNKKGSYMTKTKKWEAIRKMLSEEDEEEGRRIEESQDPDSGILLPRKHVQLYGTIPSQEERMYSICNMCLRVFNPQDVLSHRACTKPFYQVQPDVLKKKPKNKNGTITKKTVTKGNQTTPPLVPIVNIEPLKVSSPVTESIRELEFKPVAVPVQKPKVVINNPTVAKSVAPLPIASSNHDVPVSSSRVSISEHQSSISSQSPTPPDSVPVVNVETSKVSPPVTEPKQEVEFKVPTALPPRKSKVAKNKSRSRQIQQPLIKVHSIPMPRLSAGVHHVAKTIVLGPGFPGTAKQLLRCQQLAALQNRMRGLPPPFTKSISQHFSGGHRSNNSSHSNKSSSSSSSSSSSGSSSGGSHNSFRPARDPRGSSSSPHQSSRGSNSGRSTASASSIVHRVPKYYDAAIHCGVTTKDDGVCMELLKCPYHGLRKQVAARTTNTSCSSYTAPNGEAKIRSAGRGTSYVPVAERIANGNTERVINNNSMVIKNDAPEVARTRASFVSKLLKIGTNIVALELPKTWKNAGPNFVGKAVPVAFPVPRNNANAVPVYKECPKPIVLPNFGVKKLDLKKELVTINIQVDADLSEQPYTKINNPTQHQITISLVEKYGF